jgi:hypothetical protein
MEGGRDINKPHSFSGKPKSQVRSFFYYDCYPGAGAGWSHLSLLGHPIHLFNAFVSYQ